MNNIERAIIMAAGTGSRMHPLTLHTPKPLVRVRGIRMIDSIIQALHKQGIYEIYVVVGHLKEQFEPLKVEYPGLNLIENPYYDSCNNIASLYVARRHICNAIILDADQIIYNPEILNPQFEQSGYNVVWTNRPTKEWLLNVQNGNIISCNRNGGTCGWQLYSISRWNTTDGIKLREHLEIEFKQKQHTDLYWDDVALFAYPQHYQLGIYPMNKEDIIEIDNLDELIAIDPTYVSIQKQ